MSSAGRGAIRREDDAYYTPAWCVRRLLEALPLPGGRWLEPSAGGGAIIRAVNDVRQDVKWTAIEINESCGPELAKIAAIPMTGDFLALAPNMSAGKFDVAILNPPFVHAREFVDACRRLAKVTVVLERLNWLECEDRNEWLRTWPPDVYVLPQRPSFTGGGTDSTAYAWFAWRSETKYSPAHLRILPCTSADERSADPRQTDLFGRLPRVLAPQLELPPPTPREVSQAEADAIVVNTLALEIGLSLGKGPSRA